MTEAELMEAVLAEIAARGNPEGYHTTREWAQMMGFVDDRAARKRIRILLEAGKMARGVVRRSQISGHDRAVPAYKFLGDT